MSEAGDGGRSVALAHRLVPALVGPDASERAITVDQSNRSVVVGERVVVKWLTPPRPVPHPGVVLCEHLAAVGFDEMPAYLGCEVVDGRVTATLTEFVAGARDGWEWFVDEVVGALRSYSFAVPLESARRLAGITARLHTALATPSTVVPEPCGEDALSGEAARARRLLDDALAATSGPVHERLARQADRIRAATSVLGDERSVAVQLVHGDLHAGQFLRSGDVVVVNDFDGNPIGGAGEGWCRRSPLIDLASLLQSIDHVGRIVQKRRPDDHEAVERWIDAAVREAQQAYAERRPLAQHDEAIVVALRAVQELHEHLYAATSLPAWSYVPDGALAAMFPDVGGR